MSDTIAPNMLVEAIMGREECTREEAIDKINGMNNHDRLREYFAWQLGSSAWAEDAIKILNLPDAITNRERTKGDVIREIPHLKTIDIKVATPNAEAFKGYPFEK